ncbi:MAG TPA: SAM-dependent methyltransferase [Anaerolineaceae bacterium]|nr:SAM-dependent methyltransferase [Anaerolineaceae bacterium]
MSNSIPNNTSISVTTSSGWSDYALLDSGDGMKLERYGEMLLSRPEPEAFWSKSLPPQDWAKANAAYNSPSQDENGTWTYRSRFNNPWIISIEGIHSKLELSSSRHIGLFPEQYPQWLWLRDHILEQHTPMKVLNLFGYTGMATLFAAQAGAQVTHVDASKKAVSWAKENQTLSDLQDKPVRWIVDDALKFVKREARRQNYYDAIVLDPPKFGRGPNGEVWEFYKYLPNLLSACESILSKQASFLLLTAYAVKASALTLQRAMQEKMQPRQGTISAGELAQQETASDRYLSRAIYALWKK